VVEERSEADRTAQPAELRKIPVALTTGWGGRRSPGGAQPMMIASMPLMARAAPPPAYAPSAALHAPQATGGPGFFARAKQALFGDEGERGGAADFMVPMHSGDVDMFEDDAAEPADRVFDLLMTQRADGAFAPSAVLESWLGPEASERLRAAMKAHGDALVATAVVVALLARDEPARESEWRPAVTKAQAWLRKQAAFDAASVLSA
jgi:hypothetical protein